MEPILETLTNASPILLFVLFMVICINDNDILIGASVVLYYFATIFTSLQFGQGYGNLVVGIITTIIVVLLYISFAVDCGSAWVVLFCLIPIVVGLLCLYNRLILENILEIEIIDDTVYKILEFDYINFYVSKINEHFEESLVTIVTTVIAGLVLDKIRNPKTKNRNNIRNTLLKEDNKEEKRTLPSQNNPSESLESSSNHFERIAPRRANPRREPSDALVNELIEQINKEREARNKS